MLRAVGEDDDFRMPVDWMLEAESDSFLGTEPDNESIVRLLVLHAICAFRKLAVEAPITLESVKIEEAVDNLVGVQALEDAARSSHLEKTESRLESEHEARPSGRGRAHGLRCRDDAVDGTRSMIGDVQRECCC